MRVHLITAESPESRRLRHGRLIQFPQLTMPLIAALTPPEHAVSHTDEIVEPVRFDIPADLVGITAPTPSALHAYGLAREFRRRGVPVVIGGPHATALPQEAARHADAVVVGEAEDTWPAFLADWQVGQWKRRYEQPTKSDMTRVPTPRFELLKMENNICELVLTRAPESRYYEAARANGMVTLREECLALVGRGETTLEEVLRVTHDWRAASPSTELRSRARD